MYLNLAYFDGLPAMSFTTDYPFLEDSFEFTGIPLPAFIGWIAGGQDFDSVDVAAIDGYEITMTRDDLEGIDIYLTHRMDGRLYGEYEDPMDRGPYALVIDSSELNAEDTEAFQYLMVWWIRHIRVN